MCGLFIAYLGYDRSPAEVKSMMVWFKAIQWIYVVRILFSLIFDYRRTITYTKVIKWIVDIAVLCDSASSHIYPRPDAQWLPWLSTILYSRKFLVAVLLAYALTDICYTTVQAMGKHTNPSLILSVSFLVFIFPWLISADDAKVYTLPYKLYRLHNACRLSVFNYSICGKECVPKAISARLISICLNG